jgi:hypothetical protein
LIDNIQEVRSKQTVLTLDNLSVLEFLVEVLGIAMAPVRSPGAFAYLPNLRQCRASDIPGAQRVSTRGIPKTLTYQVTFQMTPAQWKQSISCRNDGQRSGRASSGAELSQSGSGGCRVFNSRGRAALYGWCRRRP